MLLTITSTTRPATDLGYLLHKHPERAQSFESSVGVAHVFYPTATEDRCTAALLLEVDPIKLARTKHHGGQAVSLAQYVNDRPYAASSLLTVAMGRVFRTAMAGRCDARPELVQTPLDLEIRLPAMRSVGGAELIPRLFQPLGWHVVARPIPLDPDLPQWGDSHYHDVTLSGRQCLSAALSHLAVLIPCLDGGKHYWVTSDEVDKLIRSAGEWLPEHPERDLVVRRSLAGQRDLVLSAVGRLAETDDVAPDALDNAVPDLETESAPPPLRLQRVDAVLQALREVGARRVIDMGCGEGALTRLLIADPSYTEVVAADVSPRALMTVERRLGLDRMPDSQRARLRIVQSSLMYADRRLAGYDAMVLQEVVEHVDADRLSSLEHAVFEVARPGAVLVTTPNAEYNPRFETLRAGRMRHADHRFEWTRSDFQHWAFGTAAGHGYGVEVRPVGPLDPEVGAPTQLALFTRLDQVAAA